MIKLPLIESHVIFSLFRFSVGTVEAAARKAKTEATGEFIPVQSIVEETVKVFLHTRFTK